MTSFSEALNTHTYPRILHRSKFLFRLFHEAVHVTTLRNWYVRRALRRLLKDESMTDSCPVILDIGCGAGDHLFYASRLRKGVRCIGVDRAGDAMRLAGTHADSRLSFVWRDLEDFKRLPDADILLCLTVLQYIPDDRELLSKMRKALQPGGRLLLYVPIRNERILSSYETVVDGSGNDYDVAQARQRIYQPEDVQRLLAEAGFEVIRIEEAYGRSGKLAFEVHGLILHGLMHARIGRKIAAVIVGLFLIPAVFVLMLIDYMGHVERGNGLLVLAR